MITRKEGYLGSAKIKETHQPLQASGAKTTDSRLHHQVTVIGEPESLWAKMHLHHFCCVCYKQLHVPSRRLNPCRSHV